MFLEQNINIELQKALEDILDEMIEAIKSEIDRRGISLTGKLRDSFRKEVNRKANILEGLIVGLEYGVYVDRGIKPGDIPFTSGQKRNDFSEYINGLFEFWKELQPSLTDNEALGAAFGTAKKQEIFGVKARPFFTDTLNKFEERIVSNLTEKAAFVFSGVIRNLINDETKQFETININL